ncbi:MAG: hypothetical protein RIM96_19705 [Thalassobaculum sp.]|uniref:hypothetical protein n=1 Tax=Thalassobaculum sp. TaxID=2022740 RepID=UPI0032EAF78A
MPIYIVQEHWPVTQAVERAIEAPSPAAALEALRTLRDRDPDWYASQRSCENSDGPSTFAVWDEAMITELLVETPATGPDPLDEALDALQAALDDVDPGWHANARRILARDRPPPGPPPAVPDAASDP